MTWKEALLARLTAVPAIGARVSWVQRPQQSTLPWITLQTVSAVREQHMKGVIPTQEVRVQVDCWAMRTSEADALASAITAEMEQAATIEGVRFHRARVDGPVDRSENASDGLIHRQQLDLIFFYSNA